jgi:signal transduction histidine kinase
MERTKQNLHQLELLTAHSLDELQRLIADLRPSHLDDLGLSSALRWYANTLQDRVRLDVHVEIQGEERPVPSPVKIALFRIAQEALTNVVKHAQAKTARVVLTYADETVHIRVTDDGRGFDMDTAGSAKRISWGLKGMEERTSLLGGRFEVHSHLSEGTTVEVSIPYLQEESDENSPATGG